MSQINEIDFPKYSEFSMINFWSNVEGDIEVVEHLPNKVKGAREVNRKFSCTIFSSLKPHFARQVVDHAIDTRAQQPKIKAGDDQL